MRSTLTAARFAATTLPAVAETAIALTGDLTLLMIDSATAAVTGRVDIQADDRVLGIDYRPADMTPVGVTADHRSIVIDPLSRAVTETARMTVLLPAVNGPVSVDFNPAADRLRLMAGRTNHRVHPDTGEATVAKPLVFVAARMHANRTPTSTPRCRPLCGRPRRTTGRLPPSERLAR